MRAAIIAFTAMHDVMRYRLLQENGFSVSSFSELLKMLVGDGSGSILLLPGLVGWAPKFEDISRYQTHTEAWTSTQMAPSIVDIRISP